MPIDPKKFKLNAGWMMLWEVVKVVAMALAIVVVVKHFLFQPFYVKGASMEPSYEDHEYLIIDELTYRFNEPVRGEVVVFRYPNDTSQYFIKRVIGLPGEAVEVKESVVWINGQQLNESAYLNPAVQTTGSVNLTLGATEYFLMGDNRAASLDSRIFGPVNRSYVVGRTWFRAFPFSRLMRFSAPAYSTLQTP
ncbi:MAG: signal peptidase I [Patescibacteria group bacterium]|mgnify:CR=1 FL=1